MIFKRGLNEENAVPIFIVDCISESRSWSRPGMQGIEFSAPLYIHKENPTEQVGIVYERSATDETLLVDGMPEHAILGTAGYAGQSAPLYIKDSNINQYANFNHTKLQELFSNVEQPDEKSRKVHPEDIIDYIYASLHSPMYRKKYKEFLKTDFPRVPRPETWSEFWRLVELGRKLRELHLMRSIPKTETTFPNQGSDEVEKIEYNDSKVYINNIQCFGNVPEVAWSFYVGGYQPAQKWLKDRKGRKLGADDIIHYQKIIAILAETDRVIRQIDSTG